MTPRLANSERRRVGAPSPLRGFAPGFCPPSLGSATYKLLRYYVTETYGLPITFKLGSTGEEILWMATSRADYSSLVDYLYLAKKLVVVIVPRWSSADWFGKLVRYTTHAWHIGAEVACIADFRLSSLDRITVSEMPEEAECEKVLGKVRPLVREGCKFKGEFRDRIMPSTFNAEFLSDMSEGVVNEEMRRVVIDEMKHGFVSGYRGGAYYQRDYSAKLSPVEAERAMAKMMKEVQKGYCLGPFEQCPFPNQWASEQAFICQQFLLPKHKLVPSDEFRLIGNRSYPIARSFNDLVERRDATKFILDYEYFTFRKFLDQLARLGRNTLISLFDVRDAYKNCRMRADQLWQQVYKVEGKFFIDLGGMFGSRNAGDAWNIVMELIVASIRYHGQLRELQYFVDNGENCTAPLHDGRPDEARARKEYGYILWFLAMARVPYHQAQEPATRVKFLGWIVDTVSMTVSAPPERLKQIRALAALRGKEVSIKTCNSVAGILEFLASVMTFLKAPAGWMQRRVAALNSGGEVCDEGFRQRFVTYMSYICKVLEGWNGTTPIRRLATPLAPDLTIYADASGTHGYGAICLEAKTYIMGEWTKEELAQAFKLKASSSTYLEVMAICIAISTFANERMCISVTSDSQSAVYILQKKYCKGSDEIQGKIIATDRWLLLRGIDAYYKHIPREDANIQTVDSLSKGRVGLPKQIHALWIGSFAIGGIWLEADRVQKTPLNELLVSSFSDKSDLTQMSSLFLVRFRGYR